MQGIRGRGSHTWRGWGTWGSRGCSPGGSALGAAGAPLGDLGHGLTSQAGEEATPGFHLRRLVSLQAPPAGAGTAVLSGIAYVLGHLFPASLSPRTSWGTFPCPCQCPCVSHLLPLSLTAQQAWARCEDREVRFALAEGAEAVTPGHPV